MTRIQDLRHRVVLLKRRIVEEKDGTFTEIWEEGEAIWAKVIPYMGRELFGEEWNTLYPVRAKYKVTIRFRKERFARLQWGNITLASLCPPLIDQRCQWIAYMMYALEDGHE